MGQYPGPCINSFFLPNGRFSTMTFTFASTRTQMPQTPQSGSTTGATNAVTTFIYDATGQTPGSFRISYNCCNQNWYMATTPTLSGDFPSSGSYNGSGSVPVTGYSNCVASCFSDLTNSCGSAFIGQGGQYGYQIGQSDSTCSSTGGQVPNQCSANGQDGFIGDISGTGSVIPFSSLKGTHSYTQSYGPDSFLFSYSISLIVTVT